jgi:hypothetical protein
MRTAGPGSDQHELLLVQTDTLWKDARWGGDSDEFFFTEGQRDYKKLELVAMDAATGATRTVLTETSPDVRRDEPAVGRPAQLARGQWQPRRDLVVRAGRLGAPVPLRCGDGRAEEPHHAGTVAGRGPAARRCGPGLVYFTALGREGAAIRTSGTSTACGWTARHAAAHAGGCGPRVSVAPSGDVRGHVLAVRQAPTTVLRRPDGSVIATVQESNIEGWLAIAGGFPERFTVKARDGVTDLHGLLHRPSDFDPAKKYPVIVYIYPGPQVGSVGSRQFTVSPSGNARALAELGFIVVQLDAIRHARPLEGLP